MANNKDYHKKKTQSLAKTLAGFHDGYGGKINKTPAREIRVKNPERYK